VIRVDPDKLKKGLPSADHRPELASPIFEALAAAQLELTDSRRQFASVLRGLSGLFYRCELRPPWQMAFISEGIEPLRDIAGMSSSETAAWQRSSCRRTARR
jgi:hypothetical protein